MPTIAYFDCFSGASGDMLLGALVDAGLDLEALRKDLALLGLSDYQIKVHTQVRRGIRGTKLDVNDQGSDRPARNLAAVEQIVHGSGLPTVVVDQSLAVFRRLAEAEARIHGTTTTEVHFHEIGAVDSLVDIVGFCCGLHRLQVAEVYASPIPVGRGTVRTEHGLLPVPAPATLALLASAGAPLEPRDAHGEMVTPTGAALLSTLAVFERPRMIVRQVGYGFGTKEFPWVNTLRVWIGEATAHDHGHDHEHQHDRDHAHDLQHDHQHEHGHTHAHHTTSQSPDHEGSHS